MDKSLQGKKVAITGAAGSLFSGFGKTFVEDLLKQGCIVYAVSRTPSKLDHLANSHSSVIPILCDLTKWNEAERILTEALPEDLDMLINNAGYAKPETILDLTEAAVDEMINVNFKGTLCITKVVVKKMIASGKGGSIVNISSLASDHPCDVVLTYGMTKAAMNRLTKTLATTLGPHKIRVNSVNPSLVANTDMGDVLCDTDEKKNMVYNFSPLKVIPTTKDVSNAVVFLLSEKAKAISGQIMFVDSGAHGG